MSSSGRAAARSPPMRCGRCAAPGWRRRSSWSRPARCCAPPRRSGCPARWHDDLATIPGGGPLLVVANEFFDALPVRQYVGGSSASVLVALGGLASIRDGEVESETVARRAIDAWSARIADAASPPRAVPR